MLDKFDKIKIKIDKIRLIEVRVIEVPMYVN